MTLTGNEKLEFNDDGEISNVDVFVVRRIWIVGITSSNGGITTSNKQDIIDNVKSVNMQITKKD